MKTIGILIIALVYVCFASSQNEKLSSDFKVRGVTWGMSLDELVASENEYGIEVKYRSEAYVMSTPKIMGKTALTQYQFDDDGRLIGMTYSLSGSVDFFTAMTSLLSEKYGDCKTVNDELQMTCSWVREGTSINASYSYKVGDPGDRHIGLDYSFGLIDTLVIINEHKTSAFENL